jgi:hypothetical protein
MIATIILVTLAFFWLLVETDYLRVRLLVGDIPKPVITLNAVQCETKPVEVKTDDIIPVKVDTTPKLIAQTCELTRIQRELTDNKGRSKYITQWEHPCKTTAYQSMTIGKQTITLNATLPNLYQMIAEVSKTQTEAIRTTTVKSYTQVPMFIERVRIGSHNEYTKWNEDTRELDRLPKYKVGYHHNVVEEYTTKYHDCLPGKDWLKAHEHDTMPEPLIEISIDSKSISIDGNYKKGMIGDFVSQYTKRVKAGQKTRTILKDQHIENMGGGVYIAVN